ncbi:FGGY-family carbohydrate kinase [Cyanobium sp. NIES-981]|uniref:FGGY-family carbohydrate kinase n=1 Tax=Cyanobium sp. NIES-981 TaxID=1851505 RepID=UPI0007DD2D14|nr:FGGY-family carbohydrate kinase [Cyanobium sp. NIES-981]SBO43487.1 Carbohydrate kinase, fggy family [Cyanobium sp. NIES-981]
MPPLLPCALGLDLGTSGLRLVVVDAAGRPLDEQASPYPAPFDDPLGWQRGFQHLCSRIPEALRQAVGAIAIDGTSGTLLLCRQDGTLLEGRPGRALSYAQACPEQGAAAEAIAGGPPALVGPAASASGSLARALRLLESVPGPTDGLLLRHQADWLMGWLLGTWQWGEAGNNLRLGWHLERGQWCGQISAQPWSAALPRICASGTPLGPLAPGPARALGLPRQCQVVAGSTDANAGVLAANPSPEDGITVLGTTLVLKQFSTMPVHGSGISCHRVAGRWLVGGASNSGAGVLSRFYSPVQLEELSRQINPAQPTGLALRPLLGRGERFPVDDPGLEPVLEPRPVSDVLYLQALLEALADIELAGWRKLASLGIPPIRRVITLGGGARNPQWRRLREQRLGVPVLNRPGLSAALGMARLAASKLESSLATP